MGRRCIATAGHRGLEAIAPPSPVPSLPSAASTKELALRLRAAVASSDRSPLRSYQGRALVAEVAERAHEFTPQGLAMCCTSLAKARASAQASQLDDHLRLGLVRLAREAALAVLRAPQAFNEQDVANTLNALARSHVRCNAALDAFQVFLQRREPLSCFFSSQGLANTLNSFATFGVELHEPLQTALGAAATHHAQKFTSAQLANVLNSLARLRMQESLRVNHDQWSSAVEARLPGLNVQGASNVLNAFARLDVADTALVPKLLSHLTASNMDHFNEQEVANVLNACVRLRVDCNQLLAALEANVFDRVVPTFTSQGLANTLLAISRLPHTNTMVKRLVQECFHRLRPGGPVCGGWREPQHVVNAAFALCIVGDTCALPRALHDTLLAAMLRALHGLLQQSLGTASCSALSPACVSQLLTVLTDAVVGRSDALRVRSLADLVVYQHTLQRCDLGTLLSAFQEGVSSHAYTVRTRLHESVSETIVAISADSADPARVSRGAAVPACDASVLSMALRVEEAFVPPYIVDILLLPHSDAVHRNNSVSLLSAPGVA